MTRPIKQGTSTHITRRLPACLPADRLSTRLVCQEWPDRSSFKTNMNGKKRGVRMAGRDGGREGGREEGQKGAGWATLKG
mmetsp:Transcript_44034/g.109800  ORF Transcript_44034/g.109800 Transcript_44034/m.109800 type:complete len:80 (-) Transcript_44034:1274-1513(-)